MIDLQALRRRVSGEPDAHGAIGPVCLTLRESLALIDELGAARVDQARYQWVRQNIGVYRTNSGKGPVSPYLLSRVPASFAISHETDEAIDAAMACQPKE